MARRGHDFDVTNARTHFGTDASPLVQRLLRPLHRGRTLEAVRDLALAVAPGWPNALQSLQERNAALAASVLEITGRRFVVDSSKIGLRLKFLLRNPALEIRVVRLIRDGRGVALTHLDPARFADAKDPRLRGGGLGDGREGEKLDMAGAAREWRRSNEEAEAVLAGLDRRRFVLVHYESLCADPAGTLRGIFSFLGLADVAVDTRLERHVVGNGMRLDWQGDVKLDESWRQALGPEDLRTFERVAGDLNRRYGYA